MGELKAGGSKLVDPVVARVAQPFLHHSLDTDSTPPSSPESTPPATPTSGTSPVIEISGRRILLINDDEAYNEFYGDIFDMYACRTTTRDDVLHEHEVAP
jgi:hypothetical protein